MPEYYLGLGDTFGNGAMEEAGREGSLFGSRRHRGPGKIFTICS
jgi:hypothetical protein